MSFTNSGIRVLRNFAPTHALIARSSSICRTLVTEREKLVNHMGEPENKLACSLKELIDFYKKRKRIKKYVVGSDKIPINSMLLGDDHSAIAEGRIPINLMAIMRLHLRTLAIFMDSSSFINENTIFDFIDHEMRMVEAVRYLHWSNESHGNLKPENVLIYALPPQEISREEIHDSYLTVSLVNATNPVLMGWKAPELSSLEYPIQQCKKADMFSLGCILYFCLSGGYHPFDEVSSDDEAVLECLIDYELVFRTIDENWRENIMKNKINLSHVEDMPEAFHLISRLLSPDPDIRPAPCDVEYHPLFWDPNVKLDFICSVLSNISDNGDHIVCKLIKKNVPAVMDPKWVDKFKAFVKLYKKCTLVSSKKHMRDLQDVLGPRHKSASGFYQRLVVALFVITYKYATKDDIWYFRSHIYH